LFSLAVIAGLAGLVSLAAALWMTGRLRAYAWQRSILDHPGERSSHDQPTPRGGGLAIVATAVAALGAAALGGILDPRLLLGLGWLIVAAAVVGAVDDRRGLPAAPRLAAHLVIAAVAVALIGPFPGVHAAGLDLAGPGAVAVIATVVWVVWIGNLYNFMDGIDGIAAAQGIVAFATLALWFAACGEPGLALAAVCTVGAILGFMVWNWAPAAIFMGDAGSVPLGMLYAGFAVAGVTRCGMPLGAFVILLGIFIGDATWTLLRRMARREPFWRAHRSHFYQRAAGAGAGHARVSAAVFVLGCILALLASAELAGVVPGYASAGVALVLLIAGGTAVTVTERRSIAD